MNRRANSWTSIQNNTIVCILLIDKAGYNMADHDVVRDQITEAAREVFAKYGYRKTTIEDIASAVYKAKSSVYHYFSGKDEIFRAVVEREASQWILSLRLAVDDEKTPVLKFRTFFKFLCEKMEESTNYFNFIKDEWYDVFSFTNEVKKKYEKVVTDIIVSIFNDGNVQGVFDVDDPEGKAKAIRVALFGFMMPWGILGSGEVSDSIDPFLDVMLFGIMKHPEKTC
jgi:AcrR family transcriptional regulator